MIFAAFDLSKRSTGFAAWDDTRPTPTSGRWVLGGEHSTDGRVYATLHAKMMELWRLTRFEFVSIEEPIDPRSLSGHTNIATLRVLAGLAAHAESFAHAVGCRTFRRVNVTSWRRDFLGPQKRGTKTAAFKRMCIERCRQLGFDPQTDDEADALGILDYEVGLRGITPPWRRDNALLAPLQVSA